MLRIIYSLILVLATPLIFLRLLVRGFRQRGYWQNMGERWGRFAQTPGQDSLWIHAVSVGEMRAAQPLIQRLRMDYPGRTLILSCMTATGREVAHELYAESAICVYLPYDFLILHKRFISHFRPSILIIMETEIWPNLLAACRAADVPALLVNARLSEKSRHGYAQFAPARTLIRDALASLHSVAAQSASDAARLASLGAHHIHVTGNIKFDVPIDPGLVSRGHAWRQALPAGRRVVLAASTREGEESMLLAAWQKVFPGEGQNPPLLVLVPRHPQRFDEVYLLIEATGLRCGRRSLTGAPAANANVWLGDSMGEMAAYVALCDVAFIGGSLLPLGGQNLIEACAQGKPVVMGPSSFNFSDAVQLATAAGALRQGIDADEVMRAARELLENEEAYSAASLAASTFAREHAGATKKTMGLIAPLLNLRNP